MDKKFELGDPVNIVGSERTAVVDDIDTGFGVAVYAVRFDDQPVSRQWFAPHELAPRTQDKQVSCWALVIAGICRLWTRCRRAKRSNGERQRPRPA